MGKTKQATPQRMFIATEDFATSLGDVPHTVHKDVTRVWEPHELLERFPFWFKEIDAHYGTRAVEESA